MSVQLHDSTCELLQSNLLPSLQMLTHLGSFPARLAENGHAVYEYTPCPPVGYPELDAELWCHRYYLRNLCDTERFPDWPIVDHVPFLQVGQGACNRGCGESWHDLPASVHMQVADDSSAAPATQLECT